MSNKRVCDVVIEYIELTKDKECCRGLNRITLLCGWVGGEDGVGQGVK